MKQNIDILLKDKKYIIPGKNVRWKLVNQKIYLYVVLKDEKIDPEQLLESFGKPISWRMMYEDNDIVLTCIWNVRMIQQAMFNSLNNILSQISINLEDDVCSE